MDDDLKNLWQTQQDHPKLRISPELLLREVQRNHRTFRMEILMRDIREIAVAIPCVGLFIYLALTGWGWPWWIMAGACLWVAGFLLLDRLIGRHRQATPGVSIVDCAASSLKQVNHQIWLLRHVLWWYLLPLYVGELAVLAYYGQQVWGSAWDLAFIGAVAALCTAISVGVYWLNRLASHNELVPRRQELEALVSELQQAD
jgi:hypothetical protein